MNLFPANGSLVVLAKNSSDNFDVKAAEIDERKSLRIDQYGGICVACGRRFELAFTFEITPRIFGKDH